jgi:hypothetical protein
MRISPPRRAGEKSSLIMSHTWGIVVLSGRTGVIQPARVQTNLYSSHATMSSRTTDRNEITRRAVGASRASRSGLLPGSAAEGAVVPSCRPTLPSRPQPVTGQCVRSLMAANPGFGMR